MLDPRLLNWGSQESEERTEPASASQFESYSSLAGLVHEANAVPLDSAVPLDDLRVDESHRRQGIRILVRDLTNSRSVSPTDASSHWVVLRGEVAADEEHQVLAVAQTPRDIKYEARVPGDTTRPTLLCDIYYDPSSDHIILQNKSEVPITLNRVSRQVPASPSVEHAVNPYSVRNLSPGTWRVTLRDRAVLDFRILEKAPFHLFAADSGPALGDSGLGVKRGLDEGDDDDTRGEKKVRFSDDKDSVVMILPLCLPGTRGKEVSSAHAQPLLDMQQGETVQVTQQNAQGEIDSYQVTRKDPIANTSLSQVYSAKYSKRPDVVTVKVLKSRANLPRAPDVDRNVIRQADMWQREFQSHDSLAHDSIVKLHGGDARFLSLYMEHVQAKDLSSKTNWRCHQTNRFLGGRPDAERILGDISGALNYLHEKRMVHNDIKPGNILYSRERGAVLCDFGLSTKAAATASSGGTPYYVPPEYIGNRARGPPSDVWALGVTMLYVTNKISFPEARAAAKRGTKTLYWQIAEVNRAGTGAAAAAQMQAWLSEVNEAKTALDSRDALEKVIVGMLAPQPRARVTMGDIMGVAATWRDE